MQRREIEMRIEVSAQQSDAGGRGACSGGRERRIEVSVLLLMVQRSEVPSGGRPPLLDVKREERGCLLSLPMT